MYRLSLIRHAKSSWDHAELSDFERPLNDRGRRDAPVMAARLKARGAPPDVLVSSPALRAISTARVFASVWGVPGDEILLQSKIYEASAGTLLSVVNGFDDRHRHIALFGHNPGLSQLAHLLADCSFDDLPTCGIAQLSLTIRRWADATPGCGTLVYSSRPKAP